MCKGRLEASRLQIVILMHALEIDGELLASERPTIPVPEPRESGVRLKVARIAWAFATVDVVVCDLTRDPRSEDYCSAAEDDRTAQNDRPPSMSTVRALK